MTDMLVKLYELADDWSFLASQQAKGIVIRKPIGPEHDLLADWVKAHFNPCWASEARTALARKPASCYLAQRDAALIGFACYDATALGYFGPGGVLEPYRGQGTGRALLLACLKEMKLKGYGYAIVGGVGPQAFYRAAVGAVEIPGSTPGLYKNLLKS